MNFKKFCKKILCKIGFHQWSQWRASFYKDATLSIVRDKKEDERSCYNCGTI
jgi:hypothetical protein